jgi:hypothetical protein
MIIKLGGDKKIEIDSWELSKLVTVVTMIAMAITEASKNKSKKDS